MDKVQKLKQQLAEAEAIAREKVIGDELQRMSKNIGKCSSTHTFDRRHKNIHAYVEMITGVDHDRDNYYYKIKLIQLIEIRDQLIEIKRQVTKKSANSYHPYRHEISQAQFNSLWDNVGPAINILGLSFRALLQQDEYITNGDHTDMSRKKDRIIAGCVPHIKIEDSRIIELLEWNNHPLLIADLLLTSPESLFMVHTIIAELKKSAVDWGGKIYERDMERALYLEKFMNDKFSKAHG